RRALADVPQEDSDPRDGVERAVTWAARRWGRRPRMAAARRRNALARGRFRLSASPGLLRSLPGEIVDLVRVDGENDAPATGVSVVDDELCRVRFVDLLAGEIGDEDRLACHRLPLSCWTARA